MAAKKKTTRKVHRVNVKSEPVYLTYRFGPTEKNPVIHQARSAISGAGLGIPAGKNSESAKWKEVAVRSGVRVQTLRNWFLGKTRDPRHSTVAAVAGALDCELEWVPRRGRSFEQPLLDISKAAAAFRGRKR